MRKDHKTPKTHAPDDEVSKPDDAVPDDARKDDDAPRPKPPGYGQFKPIKSSGAIGLGIYKK
jgi:hypothetical protein